MKRQRAMRWAAGAAAGVAVAVGVVLAFTYLTGRESTAVRVGEPAPELHLPSLGGGKARLSAYRGRAVLLVMFLSGCHICEREIGQVERLHRQYLQKGLTVVGVAVDKEESSVRSFVERHSITFIVLLDPDGRAVRAAYGSWKMPEAYLIDPSGTVSGVFLGSVKWRGPEMRERIRSLLPAPKAAPASS